MKKLFLVFFLTLPFFGIVRAQDDYKDLDAYIQKAVKDFELPGLSIAIVKGDQVIFNNSYGMADIGNERPVTNKSLFNIASCSKAFTAACIAILVEEGKLSWDDKIIDHIPNFKLADPYITQELTLVDMLSTELAWILFTAIYFGMKQIIPLKKLFLEWSICPSKTNSEQNLDTRITSS